MNNGKRSRPMLLGDRVHLLREDGEFKDYAIITAASSRGLRVVLLAEFDVELAQVFAYPASNLEFSVEGECWVGPLPPDRSRLILPS